MSLSSLTKKVLQPEFLFNKNSINSCHRSYSIAGSNFRSLSNIPHCWPIRPGPFLSSSVVDHPLRPTKNQGLGALLITTNYLIFYKVIF